MATKGFLGLLTAPDDWIGTRARFSRVSAAWAAAQTSPLTLYTTLSHAGCATLIHQLACKSGCCAMHPDVLAVWLRCPAPQGAAVCSLLSAVPHRPGSPAPSAAGSRRRRASGTWSHPRWRRGRGEQCRRRRSRTGRRWRPAAHSEKPEAAGVTDRTDSHAAAALMQVDCLLLGWQRSASRNPHAQDLYLLGELGVVLLLLLVEADVLQQHQLQCGQVGWWHGGNCVSSLLARARKSGLPWRAKFSVTGPPLRRERTHRAVADGVHGVGDLLADAVIDQLDLRMQQGRRAGKVATFLALCIPRCCLASGASSKRVLCAVLLREACTYGLAQQLGQAADNWGQGVLLLVLLLVLALGAAL